MLFGHRESGFAKAFPDDPVGVKIDLPVVVIMDVGPHRQDRAGQVELQDFHIRSRISEDVGNFGQTLLQKLDGLGMVHTVVQLGLEVHPAVGIGGKILDVIGKDLVVADEGADVVRGVDGGG